MVQVTHEVPHPLVVGVRRVTGLETTTDGIPVQGMLDPVILSVMMKAAGARAAQMLRRFKIPFISLNPGASYRGFHDSIVNHLGNETPGYALSGVSGGSPADKAGVEPGDIITRFDGKAIEKSTDLQRLVGNTKPGTKSTLTLQRLGKSRELSVTVGEFEADTATGNPT